MTTELDLAYTITPITDGIPADDEAFRSQLVQWAKIHSLDYALVFADDGVNWGWFDGTWHWSYECFNCSPKLQAQTMQQIRLFGATSELFVWRCEGGWHGRVITDVAAAGERILDQDYLLWSGDDQGMSAKGGFMLLSDGAQGLRHAPPVAIAQQRKLTVRHYVDYDCADGCARVAISRLFVTGEK